ncbi:MAG: hypothetical protein OZSIB_0101 [Candidatus Ozemobacter sibiricus]|uniref:Uncharacterized protein n=1 Tax=Candidatus Ozemobacter sibiricus TaxID=2268124 RepID=A0A367Z965_9BACT|nr:MAG: hypothetical protein OZSIB_0101 [Candidatus Ozemobacter sibiricus]
MTKPFSIPHPLNPEDADRLFLQIKQAILKNLQVLNPVLKKKFGKLRAWKLFRADVAFEDKGEVIDLVLELGHESPQRYLLIDLSVPCLGKGQKYTLDAKAKLFHEEFGIATSRIKKAILLIKKGNESVSFGSSRLQVPILELSLQRLFGSASDQEDEEGEETDAATARPAPLPKDLLLSLKEAIVHEALATMHKRRNKYVRRGLWRWLEREILDPNVHFFLIILSSIYQGKTSEVLSRTFKDLEQFTKHPEQVIERLFSEETGLAPEIVQAADRHRKALQKFLECFAATPPYEYLRSLFLKEFRSTRDSLKARLAVYDTLRELLVRCGFTGEKEVQYPLEILDELGIFQGLLMGNYTELRVENAIKKLQQLVPDRTWTAEEVYRLRDDLAHLLHLPPNEFNLNAFLPQTFSQAEGQKGRGTRAGAEGRTRAAEHDFGGFEEGGVPAAAIAAYPRRVPPAEVVAPLALAPAEEAATPATLAAAAPVAEPGPAAPDLAQPAAGPNGGDRAEGRSRRGRRRRGRPDQAEATDTQTPPTGLAAPAPLAASLAAEAMPASPAIPEPAAAAVELAGAPPSAIGSAATVASGLGESRPPLPSDIVAAASAEAATPTGLSPAAAGDLPPAARPTPTPNGGARSGAPAATARPAQAPTGHTGQAGQRPNQPPPARPFPRDLDEARHRHFENFGGHTEEDLEAIQFALEMDRAPAPAPAPVVKAPVEEEFDPALELPPRKKPQLGQQPGKPTFTVVFDPLAPRDAMPRKRPSGSGRRRSRGKRRHQGGGQRPPTPGA